MNGSRMKARPRARFVLVLLALATTLAIGCGSDDSKAPSGDQGSTASTAPASDASGKVVQAVADLVPDDVKAEGKIDNAIYNDAAPQMFLEGGKLVGIQPDFAAAVSAVMGIEFNTVPVGSFDSIIPGLQGGRYDIAFSDFGITAEREKVVDLVVQFDLGTGFASKKGSGTTVAQASDLCGLRLGTLTGSYFLDQAKALSEQCRADGAEPIAIQAFPTQSTAVLAVTNGRTDLYASSSDQIAYVAKKEGAGVEAQSFAYEPIPQGIGLPESSPLGPAVQAAVRELIANGTYDEILAEWGLESSAVPAERIEIDPSVS